VAGGDKKDTSMMGVKKAKNRGFRGVFAGIKNSSQKSPSIIRFCASTRSLRPYIYYLVNYHIRQRKCEKSKKPSPDRISLYVANTCCLQAVGDTATGDG
jgi:hypothetical protein